MKKVILFSLSYCDWKRGEALTKKYHAINLIDM